MPPVKRLQQKPRTKSTDNTRTVELRKERSRDAARSRRGKENAQFDELAKLLPLPSAITSQLDKASIVRLTISYLNMKQFNLPKIVKRFRQPSDCSFLSESSASPPSDVDIDNHFGSPGSLSPHSSVSSPTVGASTSTGAVVPYSQTDISLQELADNSGIFLLQALDGFLFVLSSDGKVLYVSETVSNHLGLSQVELTGSNITCYIHPEDHQDLFNVLEAAKEEIENPSNQPAASTFTDNIPFFGNQQAFMNGDGPDEEKPKSFFIRMKCTLVRRGGAYTKSSGFKVIHSMGRMKKYRAKGLPDIKYAFVAIGQPLPTMNINELPLECNMFVSRVNMDLKIVYCEGRIHRFMDYFARDIVGISAYDFYHANDISAIQGHHAKFLTKGQVLTKYYRWMNKNGGWVWMQTKASLIPHPTNPELKQMLCLNYIVSDVEHRGVVLGMTQLEDKPSMEPRAYITEVENESDETGQLKDAQFDDQVMVYPKWHENSDKLVPKPTLMDTLALSRSGYPTVAAHDVPTLADEVFTTMSEPLSKATTSTSWGTRFSNKGNDGSTSTLEDDFEDLTEIINAELTKLDREIVNYVANGSNDMSVPQLPDINLENMLNSNWLGRPSSNGTVQSGRPLGAPKIEAIPVDDDISYDGQNIQPPSIPTQSIGNLPVGSYPDDIKPSLIHMEDDSMTYQLPSSKRRAINSPCMFGSTTSAVDRSFQQNGPIVNHVNTLGSASMVDAAQQMPVLRTANNMDTSGAVLTNVAYASAPQVIMSGRLPSQAPAVTSTVTSSGSVLPMASQKETQLQLAQLLKEALPENTYTDQMVVDLVDEMMVDQEDEAQRRKDDIRLASLLQQGGFMQTEPFIKQEVVTPTMPQSTFAFPSISNSMATQSCQPQMPTSTFTTTNTFNGSETTFMGSPQRQQNGTVNNQSSANNNTQFMNQEDTNMNFLNSLPNNQTGLPGNTSWNTNILPKQNVMQQGMRNMLQNTSNLSASNQRSNSGLRPQSSMPFIQQQNFNLVPQNGSRIPQGSSLNVSVVPTNMSQLDSLLQSGQLPTPNYQNINGTNMPFGSQNHVKFDMTRKL